MRTWQTRDVGTTPGFDGTDRALRSITARVLYMPSATDLYFPVTHARAEAGFLRHGTLLPIPSCGTLSLCCRGLLPWRHEKWPDAGLDIGEEEIEPIEAAQSPAR